MNSKVILSLAAVAGLALVTLLIGVIYAVGTYNSAATLQNTYNMKVKDNSSEFDNMWKTISQTAQIPEAKKNAFKEIYTEYAAARTSQSQNQMMTWVKESAPNVDLSTYDKLMNIITGTRQSWTFRQKELVAIAEEYNKKMVTFPSNILLGMFGFKAIDPKVITSSRTEETFQTGKDDDVNLFNNK